MLQHISPTAQLSPVARTRIKVFFQLIYASEEGLGLVPDVNDFLLIGLSSEYFRKLLADELCS